MQRDATAAPPAAPTPLSEAHAHVPVGGMLASSQSLGTEVLSQWADDSTLVITIIDPTGAGDVLVGVNGRAVSGASLMKVLYVEYRRRRRRRLEWRRAAPRGCHVPATAALAN